MLALIAIYILSALGLAVFGFNAFVLSATFLRHRHHAPPQPPDPEHWPSVVVQLPVYNERHVVERLLDAVAGLDYPPDRLTIQLLDDSTDDTSAIAQAHLDARRQQGTDRPRIDHVRRGTREGFKAGALSAGLEAAGDAELVAIFDADFVPRPNFLRRVVPRFADEAIGLVQTRWSHLNPHYSSLTRAQALALDSHFVVEQTARQRSGLFMNFSGTAGVWRRSCIEDSGGWQGDTLSEDIDLSYRAQLRGWRFLYLPDVDSPAEIPPQMAAFKRQQVRWATGTVQCLLKLWRPLLAARLTLWQRFQGFLHLSGYLVHPLLLLLLLSTIPLMLTGHLHNLPLAPLGLAALGPPFMSLIAQITLHRDWPGRIVYFPVFLLMGAGITLSNTLAVGRALAGKPDSFRRTPKFRLDSRQDRWTISAYALPIERTTWAELALALYAASGGLLALTRSPSLVPFMALYAFGFGYVGGLGVLQARRLRTERRRAHARHALAGINAPQ